MTENTNVYVYEEFAAAMKKIRAQYKRGTKKLKWTGPNNFHSKISGTQFEPSWHFSPEGLAYHRERGRNFEDICLTIAVQFGSHQAFAQDEKEFIILNNRIDTANTISDFFREKVIELRVKYEPDSLKAPKSIKERLLSMCNTPVEDNAEAN